MRPIWKVLAIIIPVFVLLHFDGIWDGAFIGWADLHQGLAAWVQAGGVFAAVIWSGQLARDLAKSQDDARREQLVASTQAVVAKALSAINDVEAALILKADGAVVRDPVEVLDVVSQALTPKRIHELPDHTMVDLAVDIRVDLAELWIWLKKAGPLFEPGGEALRPARMPVRMVALIARGKSDCETFVKYAASGKWR